MDPCPKETIAQMKARVYKNTNDKQTTKSFLYSKATKNIIRLSRRRQLNSICNAVVASWILIQILQDQPPQNNAYFGNSVSIFNNTLVISSYRKDDTFTDQGVVYFYKKINSIWSSPQKIVASDANTTDLFGNSQSIYNTNAIIGAQAKDNGVNFSQGAVYLYESNLGIWGNEQKILASDGSITNFFGCDVDIYNNNIIVGARGKNFSRGCVYFYEKVGGIWTNEQILNSSDGTNNDFFGYAVSIFNNYVVVGAPSKNFAKGSLYFYEKVGGIWTNEQILTLSSPVIGDFFGNDVCIYNNYAFVGAYGRNTNQGAVYVYKRIGLLWTLIQTIEASDKTTTTFFGTNISSYNDNLLITSLDKFYIFKNINNIWTETKKYELSTNIESCSIYNNNIAIGSVDYSPPNQGGVFIYEYK